MSALISTGRPVVQCLTVHATDKAESIEVLRESLRYSAAEIVSANFVDGAIRAVVHMTLIIDPVLVIGAIRRCGYEVVVPCNFHLSSAPHGSVQPTRRPHWFARLLRRIALT